MAPPYSNFAPLSPVRRNGLADLFIVAVSRRGAPGGAVAGAGQVYPSIPLASLLGIRFLHQHIYRGIDVIFWGVFHVITHNA